MILTTLVLHAADLEQISASVHGASPIAAVVIDQPGGQLTIQLSGPTAATDLAAGLRAMADKIEDAHREWEQQTDD